MTIPKKASSFTQLIDALATADEARRRNPSRYTSDGYLKPVCAVHRPYKDSLACEVCGVLVGGPGSGGRKFEMEIDKTLWHP